MSDNQHQQQQIVRQLFDEVWNRGNLAALDNLVTNDFVNHDPMNQTQGAQAYREVVSKYRAAFPDCRLTIDEIISASDRVVVRYQFAGTHRGALDGIPPTGRQVRGTGIIINQFAGNRIQAAFVNWDALGLMQQLGVVTLPGFVKAAGR